MRGRGWLLVLVIAATPAWAAEPAPIASGAALVDGAKGIRVVRSLWDEHGHRQVSVASEGVTSDWLRRLAAVALRDEGRLPDAQCYVTCNPCADQLLVDVSFRTGTTDWFLSLRPREGLALVRSRRTAVWSLGDSITAVLALIREALPNDEALRAWAGSAGAQPQADPDSAAYRFDDLLVTSLPEAIKRQAPSYPDAAREAKITGLVMVEALVVPDGSVAQVRISESVPGLDEAAMEAVHRWRFKPARCGDRPIPVRLVVPVRFSIH
ncbi:MAG TPA: energy transducer TonB [Candidatus Eisenbacteria bacterium]|nr:energy transducer TonB [Candidatus Eisenbacteria bacterium]